MSPGMADRENIGIAVGIALLASLGGEIYAFHECRSQSWILHFPFPPIWSYNIDTCPIGMADSENIVIAVGIALLASVETEIIVLPHPLPV